MRQKPHGLGPPTARLKTKAPDHGRHIYAYRHVQTNQVVYSFTRTLDGIRSLRQLPDIGANTAQATGRVRRDLWRPLWSVTFPHAEHGAEQGQHAFKHLREYRRLHELYWKQPASLTKPMSEEKKEELDERLKNRTVKKKETVFELIKKEKRKHKRELIMDQKANSIADLAAVLDTQEWLGVEIAARHDRQYTRERLKEVREMLRMSIEARQGGLQKIEKEIADLQPYLDRQEGFRIEDGAEMGQREAQRKKLQLEYKMEKMRLAAAAFERLPQKQEEMERLEEIEAQVEEDLSRLNGEEQASRIEGELEGIREAKELVRQGSSLQPLREAIELEQAKPESRPDVAPAARLSKAETADLQRKVDGYEGAVNPASILAKLQTTNTAESIDPGASNLEAILKDLQEKRSGLKVEKFRGWVTGRSQGVNAQAQRLQHDIEYCQRILPAYSMAASELKYDGGEAKIQRWIADAKAKLLAAPIEEAVRQQSDRAAGVAAGYERALEAIDGAEDAQITHSAPESSRDGMIDAQTWLANLKEKEIFSLNWNSSPIGKQLNDAEREVPEVTDTLSGLTAVPVLQGKIIRTWIAMQKWAMERGMERLKKLGKASLTPIQKARVDELAGRRLELQRQEASASKQGKEFEDLVEEIEDSQEDISKAWREIEEEVSQADPKGVERIKIMAAKIEIYRQGLAKAQRKSVEETFQSIALPTSLQSSVDEWFANRAAVDYNSIGPVDFFKILPSFPAIPVPDEDLYRNKDHRVVKDFAARQKMYSHPIFTLQGVRVKWHNILDAEFASSWPQDVVHEPMGLVTYVAPEADEVAEPVLGVAEWRARGIQKRIRKKKERDEVVEGLTDAVVRAVRERIKAGVIKTDGMEAKLRVGPTRRKEREMREVGEEEV